MFRIGICDDQVSARESLRLSIERVLRQSEGHVIYEFSSGEGIISWLSKHTGELDMLFLDVEMNGINGLEAAREIRKLDSGLMLAFVTGYPDFVYDGYGVSALGYLLKPVKDDALSVVFARAQEELQRLAPIMFSFHNTDGFYRLSCHNISYFYSSGRRVFLVTHDREYAFYDKLDSVAGRLPSSFIRIHQRYLINAEAVAAVEKDSVTIGGTSLPISRGLKSEATLALANALLGQGVAN